MYLRNYFHDAMVTVIFILTPLRDQLVDLVKPVLRKAIECEMITLCLMSENYKVLDVPIEIRN
jgi:hypothetical protein